MGKYGPGYAAARAGSPNRGNYGQGAGYGGQQTPRPMANNPQFTQDYYTYSVTIASLLAGATNIQTVTVQADSDFEWIMSSASGNLHANAEPWTDACIIPATILITDSGSGRQLESNPVPLMSIAGTGKQPFILPVPRRFMAKSTITMTFTSYSASEWNNIYFNLIGRKIFDVST